LIRTAALLGAAVLVFGAGALVYWGWSVWESRQQFMELARDPTQRASYQHRLTLFDQLKTGPTVVMLGDSITQWGEWNELIGPQVANRGIGGDTSDALLKRLERSVPASATTVVIMIGLNDLKTPGWTPERSASTVRQIVARLKGRRVILQAVLRVSDRKLSKRIEALNAELWRICAAESAEALEGCEWLDLNPVLTPDGALTSDLTRDGRHLNGRGYALWAEALKPVLDKR
jgi:lysophospholipase L1-like esterase